MAFDMAPTCIWSLDVKIRKSCENITFHSQDANFPKSCGRPVLSSLPFSESISKKLLPNYLYSISKQVLHVLIMAASTTNLFSETWVYEVNVNSEVTIHYKGLVNQKEKKISAQGFAIAWRHFAFNSPFLTSRCQLRTTHFSPKYQKYGNTDMYLVNIFINISLCYNLTCLCTRKFKISKQGTVHGKPVASFKSLKYPWRI